MTTEDLRRKAEMGDVEAQFELGFRLGQQDQSEETAADSYRWMKMSAERGHVYGQYNTGVFLLHGYGAKKDPLEAVYWFKKAAENGFVSAQEYLGTIYGEGIDGVIVANTNEAIKWVRKAAENGSVNAQKLLGGKYYNGYDVEKDFEEGVKWMTMASQQGDAEAQCLLSSYYFNKYGFQHEEGMKWLARSIEQNYPDAQYLLGLCYYNGDGVEKNKELAIEWLMKAAMQGHARAQYSIARSRYNNDGTQEEKEEVFNWAMKAAAQGCAEAQFMVGLLYELGEGVEKNTEEARKWIQAAANQGLQEAKEHIYNNPVGDVQTQQIHDGRRELDNKYLKEAERLIGMNMPGQAVVSCRNALEALVNDIGEQNGINFKVDDSKEADIKTKIDMLYEAGLINESAKDLLHRVRKKGNKGAHGDYVSLEEANEAFNKISDAYRILSDYILGDSYNAPKSNPDYYLSSREYYAKWAKCYDRNSLLLIPEYVELESKANKGDIEAMLDIAVGFLPKGSGIEWSSDLLVNMPSYEHHDKKFNQDKAYDMRYYYWVLRAVTCVQDQIETFPRKYIATAIWESFKYWFYSYISPTYNYYITGINEWRDENRNYHHDPIYGDPKALIQYMFNLSDDIINEIDVWGMYTNAITAARAIFDGVTDCDFVAAIHEDARKNPYLKLRFLRYCAFAFANSCIVSKGYEFKLSEIDAIEINEDYALFRAMQGNQIDYKEVEEGEIVTWELLKPYTVGEFCNEHYNLAMIGANQFIRLSNKKDLSLNSIASGIKSLIN